MRYLKLFFFGACLSFLALQCDKDDNNDPPPPEDNKEELPPATQSGEGTFGCKVNGEVWRPEYHSPFQSEVGGSYGRRELLVTAKKENNQKTEVITIHLPEKANILKTHQIDGRDYPKNNALFFQDSINITCTYRTDSVNNGYVKLTRVDSIENIVSGRFEFTAVNDTCGDVDTIRVTDGRFDIKYAN